MGDGVNKYLPGVSRSQGLYAGAAKLEFGRSSAPVVARIRCHFRLELSESGVPRSRKSSKEIDCYVLPRF
jgi:hypothetical protein